MGVVHITVRHPTNKNTALPATAPALVSPRTDPSEREDSLIPLNPFTPFCPSNHIERFSSSTCSALVSLMSQFASIGLRRVRAPGLRDDGEGFTESYHLNTSHEGYMCLDSKETPSRPISIGVKVAALPVTFRTAIATSLHPRVDPDILFHLFFTFANG